MSERTTITLDVTVGGVSRAVDFVVSPFASNGDVAYASGFAARIGRGSKLHRCEMRARRNADGTWSTFASTTVLNRAAAIVSFADLVPELMRSQHVHSSITLNTNPATTNGDTK